METKVSLAQDDISLLRSKLKDLPELDFNRKLVGGIDPEDVAKYIRKINEQLQKSEESYRVRIDEITRSNKVLQDEVDNCKRMYEDAENTAAHLQGVIKQLQEENTILREKLEAAANNSSDSIPQQLSREREERIAELEDELNLTRNQLEQLKKQMAEQSKQDIKRDSPDLANRIFGLRGVIEDFQQQLLDLEELAKTNKELKQQVDSEKNRADKAERKLAELSQLISSFESNLS